MKQINAYITDDNEIFTSEISAKKHEALVEAKIELRELVEGEIHSYNMSSDMLIKALIENAESLEEILNKIANNR